jgi:hypothetical protein
LRQAIMAIAHIDQDHFGQLLVKIKLMKKWA